jgi:2-octaprenyl-6-methoxyphenol hydroxylase
MTDYDVIIAGGGMVGASLAHALAGAGLRAAVIEAVPRDAAAQPSYDDRAIALAYGTRRILEGLGAWADLAPAAEPIRAVHVSDRGHFGFTRLDARDEEVEALGYVVTARDLGSVLLAPLTHRDQGVRPHEPAVAGVDVFCPTRVTEFAIDPDRVSVSIRGASASVEACLHERVITAALLVAADGGQSAIRERLAVPQRHHSYGHRAVIANVTPSLPHRGVAYERFTDSGPLALLPMTGNRCGLVWTVRDADLTGVLALDDRAFLAVLQERFGFRLGRFTSVGRRSHYPLELRLAETQVLARVAIVGNAAHTVHPIAGQGFNLGIRDVAALARVLAEAQREGRDLGDLDVLETYAAARRRDHRAVVLATDALARLFVSPLSPLRLARNLGMAALDALPPLKHALARAAMGLSTGAGVP